MIKPVLPLKLFKTLMMLILTLVILIILTPIIMLAVMYDYKGFKVVADDYEATNVESVVSTGLDEFLIEQNSFDILLSTDQLNGVVVSTLQQQNPNYLNDQVSEDESKYAISESMFGYKGSKATISDDHISLLSGADLNLGFMTYRTTITIKLKALNTEKGISLQLAKLDIGSLPILPIYGFARWVGNIAGYDLNEIIESAVPIGVFDAETMTFDLAVSDLESVLVGNNEQDVLMKALFSFAQQTFGPNDEKLFGIHVKTSQNEAIKGELGVNLNLGLLKTNESFNDYAFTRLDQSQLTQVFQGQMANLLISSLTSTPGTLDLMVEEKVMNQVLDYYLQDSMVVSESLTFNGKTYTITTSPLVIDVKADQKAHVKLFIELSNGTDTFTTMFDIVTTPSLRNKDLVLTIEAAYIGDDVSIDDANIDNILAILGETTLIQGHDIVVENFTDNIANDAVTFSGLSVVENYFIFKLTPSPTLPLYQQIADIQGEIADALNELANDPNFGYINDILTNNTDPAAQQQALLEEIAQLTPTEQQALFDALSQQLDVDLSGLLQP